MAPTLHEPTKVPIDAILPSPHNKGDRFVGDEEDEAFVESIRQHGILEPLVVEQVADGRYELVAGERRWRAARAAGLTHVPIVPSSSARTSDARLTENLARKNYSAWEALNALIESVTNRRDEAAEKSQAKPSVAQVAMSLGIPKRLSERYWSVDGKLDEQTRTLVSASAVLRRCLTLADLERAATTHARDRAEMLRKLEQVYQEAANPNQVRRSGAAAGVARKATYQVKSGKVTVAKCIVTADDSMQSDDLYQPLVDLGVRIHPLCDLDDPNVRAMLAQRLSKTTNKLLAALKAGVDPRPAKGTPAKRTRSPRIEGGESNPAQDPARDLSDDDVSAEGEGDTAGYVLTNEEDDGPGSPVVPEGEEPAR